MKTLKTITLYALKRGYLLHDPFLDHHFHLNPVDRGFLTDEEILCIANKKNRDSPFGACTWSLHLFLLHWISLHRCRQSSQRASRDDGCNDWFGLNPEPIWAEHQKEVLQKRVLQHLLENGQLLCRCYGIRPPFSEGVRQTSASFVLLIIVSREAKRISVSVALLLVLWLWEYCCGRSWPHLTSLHRKQHWWFQWVPANWCQ